MLSMAAGGASRVSGLPEPAATPADLQPHHRIDHDAGVLLRRTVVHLDLANQANLTTSLPRSKRRPSIAPFRNPRCRRATAHRPARCHPRSPCRRRRPGAGWLCGAASPIAHAPPVPGLGHQYRLQRPVVDGVRIGGHDRLAHLGHDATPVRHQLEQPLRLLRYRNPLVIGVLEAGTCTWVLETG